MRIEIPDFDVADDIVDLWVDLATDQRAHGSHLLPEPNRALIRESILQHIVTDDLRVAVEDGDIVGFVMFSVESSRYDNDVTRGNVENLYVRPTHRDGGVGSRLLTAAEEALREAGADVIALEVMATNQEARRFYRRQGYRSHRVVLEKSTDGSPVETENDTKENE